MVQHLAPIVLFTYNRPEHTRITLEHLAANDLADQSILYIYCDGPREGASEKTLQKIQEVKKIIRSRQWTKEVCIKEAEKNKGLARNVMDGVTEIVNKHGKVIVLEDDLLISKSFLPYMNTALDRYETEEIIKQISGFLFPIEQRKTNTAFFLPITNTVGWGTWKRAWNEIDFQVQGYEALKTDKKLRHQFNMEGAYNYTKILLSQVEKGTNDSWAILYWWSIFQKKGITLFPDYSLIQHNDFDSSGTHVSSFDHYNHKNWDANYEITQYPDEIKVNRIAYDKLKIYINKNTGLTIKNLYIKFKSLLKL